MHQKGLLRDGAYDESPVVGDGATNQDEIHGSLHCLPQCAKRQPKWRKIPTVDRNRLLPNATRGSGTLS